MQVGAKNLDELNGLITSSVMIRRKKMEVLKQMPQKLRQQVRAIRAQQSGLGEHSVLAEDPCSTSTAEK